MPLPSAPRVFISYSHESPLHSEAVLALAYELRAAGVDAWLDVFEVSPPEGWPRWMQRQLHGADYVLCVCTATYRRRFEGAVDPDAGRGVAWEGLLAAQLLYDAGSENRGGRFVAVVLDGHDPDAAVPLALRPFGTLSWPRDGERILRRLYGAADASPSPLGRASGLIRATPVSAGLGADVASAEGDAASDLPGDLVDAYLAGDLVAFVGADVPLAAGLPAGDALPLAVLHEAGPYLGDAAAADELAAEVHAALADRAVGEALGVLMHELTRPIFNGIVAGLLDDQRRGSPLPAIAEALAALAPTLRGILTTNLDHLLEGALRGLPERWTSHPQPTATLDQRPHWLAHLRGAIGEDPRGWALTEGDLRELLRREQLAGAWIESLLLSRSALFVGFNLDDPDIADVLARLASLTRGRGRRHFALVDASNARSLRPQRRRELAKAGVTVLPCGHTEGAFGDVMAVLSALARRQIRR